MPRSKPDQLAGIRALMLADLLRSGLTAADAEAMRLKPIESAAPLGVDAPAYLIPYFGIDGKPIKGRLRARLLGEPKRAFAVEPGSGPRYLQPAGTSPWLYLPPFGDWSVIAADVEEVLWVSEGEKKSARLCKEHVPCIGLGGVWSWRSAAEGKALIDDFALIEWRGRLVVVCFDSDVVEKPQVSQALDALCRELLRLEARPAVVYLPPTADGAKVGLDDYLEAHGVEALAQLPVVEFAESARLYAFNDEFAVVDRPPSVMALRDSHLINLNQFMLRTRARRHSVAGLKRDGSPAVRMESTAEKWLEWPGRRHHPRVTYAPGQSDVCADGSINTWRAPSVVAAKPPRGGLDPYITLRDHLFASAPETREWFEAWAAWPLQHPGAKMASAVMLHGRRTGTGKSLLGLTLGACYGHNFGQIERDAIYRPFNSWSVDKQFILADEVTGSDRRQDADALKTLITRTAIEVNIKNVPQYVVPDVLNYFFTSNHPDALVLDDDDRRFFVICCDVPPLPQEFYQSYGEWLRGAGPSYLLHYFGTLDLAKFDPFARPPRTGAWADMVYHGKSAVEQWVRELLEDPDRVLKGDGDTVPPGDLWTSWDLARSFEIGCTRGKSVAVGRALAKAGSVQRHLGNVGKARVYAIRNIDKWRTASVAECATHYADTRGGARFAAVGEDGERRARKF